MTPELRAVIERKLQYHRAERNKQDERRKAAGFDSREYKTAVTLTAYHDGAADALEALLGWWGSDRS